jgi:predicted Zn-dependent protease
VRPEDDLLIVYAEAFERDADPDDYSIEAIVAHEVGHQVLRRHPELARRMARRISADSEEIIASAIGAIIAPTQADRDDLMSMAAVRLSQFNVSLPGRG